MNQIVNEQTQLFMVSIQIGIVLGMFFDLLRIIRKILPHPNWTVQIEDLFYWIAASCIGFLFLYIHNYSALRFFVFIGIFLGAALYFSTASILFMKIATETIFLVKRILGVVFKIIQIPFKYLVHLIGIPVHLLKTALGYLLNKVEKRRRKWKRKIYYCKADLYTAWQLKIKK